MDAQNDVFRPENLHLFTRKMTSLDPQNDFLSHTKLQLYTRRIKILNQKYDNCTATQKWDILWMGGEIGKKLCSIFGYFWSFKSFGSFESLIYKTWKSRIFFSANKIAFWLD